MLIPAMAKEMTTSIRVKAAAREALRGRGLSSFHSKLLVLLSKPTNLFLIGLLKTDIYTIGCLIQTLWGIVKIRPQFVSRSCSRSALYGEWAKGREYVVNHPRAGEITRTSSDNGSGD